MIKSSITLTALQSVVREMKAKDGSKIQALIIPLEANNLKEVGGKVYLNLVHFEMKESKDYATHITKQSLPKEVYEKQTQDDKDAMPLLGNLKLDGATSSSSSTSAPASMDIDVEDGDNLPF